VRRFRLWEKKRGHRTTGSTLWGHVGETLFFAALFLTGALGITVFVATGLTVRVETVQEWDWTRSIVSLVLVSLVVFGAFGVLFAVSQVGTSAERRSARAQRMRRLDQLLNRNSAGRGFPGIPSAEDLTNSPGVRLAYRLPVSFSSGWSLLFTMALFSLIWNGTTAVLIGLAVRQFRVEQVDWFFFLFVGAFLMVGVWSTQFFFQQLAQATAIGPTALEVSDHPLFPGRTYQLYLSQSGRLVIRRLEVSLVCDEEATYHQGTDIRTERRRVLDQTVLSVDEVDIGPGKPFERLDRLAMPAQVMHSFQAPHNSIQWKLLVRGEVSGWPRFERAFPIIVHPASSNRPPIQPVLPSFALHGTSHQHPTV